MSEIKLKSCPFCGSENVFMRTAEFGKLGRSAYERTYRYVQCSDCKARTGYHGTRPKAIVAWNKRAGYPCDLCEYGPQSDEDGKPCSQCPASGRLDHA